MKVSYALTDFAQECGKKIPVDAFIPLFSIIWKMVDETFRDDSFSGLKFVTFAKDCGHYGRGLWECTIDDVPVSITPIYIDLDIVTNGSIYMVWRIEIEADTKKAIDTMLTKLGLFFRKYAKDKKEFNALYARGVELMERYNPEVLSSDIRRFYNLSGGQ